MDFVHTGILSSIDTIAVDGLIYAKGFVDRFSRYLKIYPKAREMNQQKNWKELKQL